MQGQPKVEFRPTVDLQCTARVSVDGQLAEVDERWLEGNSDTTMLTGQFLLWNEKCCMLTVACNKEVEKYFGGPDPVLHVGLAKAPGMTWGDLDQWAVRGGDACDWTPDPHGIVGQDFSAATGLRRREWGGAFEARRSTLAMRGLGEESCVSLPQMTMDDPRLVEVPPSLWARNK